ncbi:DUF692 domain-containing protein [Parvibaculaceae bacterium PLY_AMNH_Bact1]|nr:DUF692 domain-containing protein [Parvibaculaceae bacterium PLY_AMNH_Bact1]
MTNHPAYQPDPILARAGVGLKADHYKRVLETKPDIGWFEVHPENYMGEGGSPHAYLSAIRQDYPLSLHGVGMSLGGVDPLDEDHLARFASLVERYQPALVSEHLAWATHQGDFLNDLLPLPLTEEALNVMAEHVDHMQSALKRQVLVENPSTYLSFVGEVMEEPEFLVALADRTGCGLLLDVNNVFVSACNHGFDPRSYIDSIPADLIGEVHVAGHAVEEINGAQLRIDDHGSAVVEDVWKLFGRLIDRVGPKPTLVEWDTNVPPWDVLKAEADKADALLKQSGPVLGRRHRDALPA